MSNAKQNLLYDIATERGGYFRSGDAARHGINRVFLQKCVEDGFVEPQGRGLYRLAELPPHPFPDFAIVSLLSPKSVICLISALSFHNLTTQIPHHIDLAVPKDARSPKIDYPPVSVHHISEPAFSAGVGTHDLNGVKVRIYSIEKTLADCFKFRNQIGMDVAVEALKLYRERQKLNANKLVEYAKVCRVMRVMEPYLESLL